MNGSVEVLRGFSRDDCAAVRPLVEAHIAFERSAVVLPEGWEATIARLLEAGRAALFVARAGARPVGYASVTVDVATWTAEPFAHLDCLFVDDAYRGAGLGRQLIGAVIEHALALGVSEVQWQTPAWNENAVGFYERLGATARPKVRFTLALEEYLSRQRAS